MNSPRQNTTLIVWDRIGDYHRARLRELEALIGREHLYSADFGGADALYGWKDTGEGERHFVLSRKPVDALDILARVKSFRRIIKTRAIGNVAIAGYGRVEYILFLLLARMMGCRITLFAESWYGSNALKNRIKGWFLRSTCHAFLVSGERSRDHFQRELGVPADRIFTGYSVVDNDHFKTVGWVRQKVLLCVARFSPEKNHEVLIRAFLKSDLAGTCRLRLIGGGPLESQLKQVAGDSPMVEFAGWVDYQQLPAEYAGASYFVLPSTFEPWGLVVNEAMAAGLPVIVSDACGCQPDLAGAGNGYVFPAEDEAALVGILNNLPEPGSGTWQRMSLRSREIINGFTCRRWAEQLQRSFQ